MFLIRSVISKERNASSCITELLRKKLCVDKNSTNLKDNAENGGFPISVRMLMCPYEEIFRPKDNVDVVIKWDEMPCRDSQKKASLEKSDAENNENEKTKINNGVDRSLNLGTAENDLHNERENGFLSSFKEICESGQKTEKTIKTSPKGSRGQFVKSFRTFFNDVMRQKREISISPRNEKDGINKNGRRPEEERLMASKADKYQSENVQTRKNIAGDFDQICELVPQGVSAESAIVDVSLDKLALTVNVSKDILDVGEESSGPDSSKSGRYKNPEYFCYHKMSYYNAHMAMSKYRLPQPSNRPSNNKTEAS